MEIPPLGFGLFQVDPGETRRVVDRAIEVGYRHFDSASAYGNEAELGTALRSSSLPRDAFFVTTKLWNDDHGRQRTFDAFDRSLEALGLDAVDLYLIHWPAPARGLFVETWEALQEIAGSGRAKQIGVSNFLPEHLSALEAAGLPLPAFNQIEIHPAFQQRAARDVMTAKGVRIQSWAPLGHAAYPLTGIPGLSDIAGRHGKSVHQVVIRWHLQQDLVLMPKTLDRDHMAQNLDVFDFELDADEMAVIDAAEQGLRIGSDPRTKQ